MSQKLFDLNSDLSQLREEGYNIDIPKEGCLVARDIPYLNSKGEVKIGIIISDLALSGDIINAPNSHVIFFCGEYPCTTDGQPIPGCSPNAGKDYGADLTPNHQISRKPTTGPTPGKYRNYYEKIITYINIICAPAKSIDSSVTAATYPVVEASDQRLSFPLQ